MQLIKTIGIFIIGMLIVSLFAIILFYAYQRTVAKPLPLYPLMHHTIFKGNIAMVVYLEKWEDKTDWATCKDFIIVWPAGASKGYIDAMLEKKRGAILHEYIQIGWWRVDEKFLPTITN